MSTPSESPAASNWQELGQAFSTAVERREKVRDTMGKTAEAVQAQLDAQRVILTNASFSIEAVQAACRNRAKSTDAAEAAQVMSSLPDNPLSECLRKLITRNTANSSSTGLFISCSLRRPQSSVTERTAVADSWEKLRSAVAMQTIVSAFLTASQDRLSVEEDVDEKCQLQPFVSETCRLYNGSNETGPIVRELWEKLRRHVQLCQLAAFLLEGLGDDQDPDIDTLRMRLAARDCPNLVCTCRPCRAVYAAALTEDEFGQILDLAKTKHVIYFSQGCEKRGDKWI